MSGDDKSVTMCADDSKSIFDSPRAGQIVSHEGRDYTTIKEGLAYILVPQDTVLENDPKKSKDDKEGVQSVFYNPIQQFNRDLSVLAIRAFGEAFVTYKENDKQLRRRKPKKKRPKNGCHEAAETQRPEPERLEDGVVPVIEDGASQVTKRKIDDPTESADSMPPPKKTKVDETSGHQKFNNKRTVGLANQEPLQQSGDSQDGSVHEGITDLIEEQGIADEDLVALEATSKDLNQLKPPDFRILDALSATGLRALRYSHELPFVTSVTANDMKKEAAASIKANAKHNKLEDKINVVTGNALAEMYRYVGQEEKHGPGPLYDVIDLDPYGTAVPFLDASVQAIRNGGLLCVTCTDTSVFAGVGYPEKCYSQYGGLPLKGPHCHEGGIRLVLHAIASAAARYGNAIDPLLSLSIDYYARVFVRFRRQPADVKFLAGKTMFVYNCDAGCGAWTTQFLARNSLQLGKKGGTFYKHGFAQAPVAEPLCSHCGTKTHLSGPMYGGPLHNADFIKKILSYLPDLSAETYGTTLRIEGMLQTALEELEISKEGPSDTHDCKAETANKSPNPRHTSPFPSDPAAIDHHPFYFFPSALAGTLHCIAPSDAAIKGALRHAGFRAVRSHTKPGSIKTDASWDALWHIMREWVRQKAPIKEGSLKSSTLR